MEQVNETLMREFVFLGFSSLARLQLLLFVVFLLLYLFTLGTNAIIISTIVLDRALHTPMYFFLAVLSCSETCYTFVIVPKMLTDLLAKKKTISFLGCTIQMFSFLFLGCSHSFLLAVMGYDRYMAICNPLNYMVLMGHGVCVGLVAAACACGFTVSLVTTSLIFNLPFHSSNQLHHFFCDTSPVLKLASHHSHLSQLVLFMLALFALVIPLLLILVSYIRIISAILKIPSSVERYKTFSTCASHLIVITVHYGCASFIYLRPKSNYSSSQDILISVSYTILTPLFNPMIYSLRNREFKTALRRLMGQTSCPVN
ncbi:olfactory receptor family 10 subfamily K member 1D [Equus caballus]|uniref:olfactory receptor family 10 subfamily K member 1D n=1 Tax=Equus caballus TaxID=9796 RepID=UPI000179611F|nr:olfactory receptor family 10 subfamily K member 1D [Equus caballus]XP_008530351.1 PREDICTED: olfactory receptor 10K1 [Equus przewalskii]